jgi:hypothetical protein
MHYYRLRRNGTTDALPGTKGHPFDITGQKFGKLTAVQYVPSRVRWKCRCDCGKETMALAYNLRAGLSKSCGCASRIAPIGRSGGRGGIKNSPRWDEYLNRNSWVLDEDA